MQHHAATGGHTARQVLVIYAVYVGCAVIAAVVLLVLVVWLRQRFPRLRWEAVALVLVITATAVVDVELAGIAAALGCLAVLFTGICEYMQGRELERQAHVCRRSPAQWQAHLEHRCACSPSRPGGRGSRPDAAAATRCPTTVTVPWAGTTVAVAGPSEVPAPDVTIGCRSVALAPGPLGDRHVTSARRHLRPLVPDDGSTSPSPGAVPSPRSGINPFADTEHMVTVPPDLLHRSAR